MKDLLLKYEHKLVRAGAAEPGAPVLGGLEVEAEWNRPADESGGEQAVLKPLLEGGGCNSVVFVPPAEPYRTILDFLADEAMAVNPDDPKITPRDCETRTFLHDITVCPEFTTEKLAEALGRSKGVVIPGRGVLAPGSVSPEQGFVTVSSILFAGFVKFFTDYLEHHRAGSVSPEREAAFDRALGFLEPGPAEPPELLRGPFTDSDQVYAAMEQAGRKVVEYGLVDSYFGNLSCLRDGVLYISRSGSSLDELAGKVDACPLDGSSCAGLTASSEFSAHRRIVEDSDTRIILHGHPRFSVIMSMDCAETECPDREMCHIKCSRDRFLGDIPVVPGEVGTGPTGLCNTLPPAVRGRRGGVVYGHGVFTFGKTDFNIAFQHLMDVENMCRKMYLERVGRG